jgi:predicted nucleic-acid-binding Zn-ribbon protein
MEARKRMWPCPKCREDVENTFEVCWNCGTARDGSEDAAFRRAEDLEPEDLESARPVVPEERIVDKPVARDKHLACSKCGCANVIPDVRIIDRGDGNWKLDLQVELYEHPDALLFKGTHQGTLRAAICGRCGHAELYVTNPGDLWAAYQRSRERS